MNQKLKNKYAVLVRAKNEKAIVEWVRYYFKLGFSFIFVYDDHSNIPVTEVFKNAGISQDKFMCITFPFTKKRLQLKSKLNNKVFRSKLHSEIFYKIENKLKQFHYLLFVDADEFLVLKGLNLDQLANMGFNEYRFRWIYFGSNNYKKLPNATTKIIPYFFKSAKKNDLNVKSMAKTINIKNISESPHVFNKNEQNKKVMNHDIAYIAHLSNQDLYTFIIRKTNCRICGYRFIKNRYKIFDIIKKEGWKEAIRKFPGLNDLYKLWTKFEKNEIDNFDLVNFMYPSDSKDQT